MGNDDENRRAILARRARFIALAVAGMSTATTASACVCLAVPDASIARDTVAIGESNDSSERDR